MKPIGQTSGEFSRKQRGVFQDRRVCFVIAGLGAGGAEKVVAWLSDSFIAAGANVSIIAFDAPDDPVYHRLPDGIDVHRLNISAKRAGRTSLPPALQRILSLRKTLKRLKSDVTISFLTKINTLTLAAALGLPVKVMVAERNNPLMQPAHWLWQKALRQLYARADAIICQTNASKICVPDRHRGRIRVIPNPVKKAPVQADNGTAPTRICAVGRLERQKGFDTLISAFALVAEEFPDCCLDIWGTGPDKDDLAAHAKASGVGDRVHLKGLSPTPGGWVSHADIFVLSSRFEGFPNVLGEAMAAGLPVIATNCDFGPSELVRHGENGLLVPIEDPEELANALRQLLTDDSLRQRLSANAPDVANTFAPDVIERSWREAVAALL